MSWDEIADQLPESPTVPERWLGAYQRLRAGPLQLRRDAHRPPSGGQAVMAPARKPEYEISLRYTSGGFGTPFFEKGTTMTGASEHGQERRQAKVRADRYAHAAWQDSLKARESTARLHRLWARHLAASPYVMEWDHLPTRDDTRTERKSERSATGPPERDSRRACITERDGSLRRNSRTPPASCELVCAQLLDRERTFRAQLRANEVALSLTSSVEAGARTRTGDPSFTRAVLYQLSYLGAACRTQSRTGPRSSAAENCSHGL